LLHDSIYYIQVLQIYILLEIKIGFLSTLYLNFAFITKHKQEQMITEIEKELANSDKPIVKIFFKNEGSKIVAIGLKKGVELANHTAPNFAKILVIKGAVNYISDNSNIVLNCLESFDIPLKEVHKVIGIESSIFLLILH
jgi:quercetin dioxygenase-like cupin family protein